MNATRLPERDGGKDFNYYAIASSIALAALLFVGGKAFPSVERVLRSAGYVGTFVLGILYVYSFTSLPATALLVIVGKTQNLWLAGTIATVGAVLGDLVVFELFRSAKRFADDHPPRRERYVGWWNAIEARIPPPWQTFVVMALVAIFLVLPLPNEFADFLLARIQRIKTSAMLAISYAGNGIGLYAIMWLARFG